MQIQLGLICQKKDPYCDSRARAVYERRAGASASPGHAHRSSQALRFTMTTCHIDPVRGKER